MFLWKDQVWYSGWPFWGAQGSGTLIPPFLSPCWLLGPSSCAHGTATGAGSAGSAGSDSWCHPQLAGCRQTG